MRKDISVDRCRKPLVPAEMEISCYKRELGLGHHEYSVPTVLLHQNHHLGLLRAPYIERAALKLHEGEGETTSWLAHEDIRLSNLLDGIISRTLQSG